MKFTPDYIYAPDASLDIKDWRFSQDLRQFFPTWSRTRGNHGIGDLLCSRGVVAVSDSDCEYSCEIDCEYSCTNVYFKTKRAATAFLKRLNAMPEIKNYTEPQPKTLVAMAEDDWKLLRHTLYEMLTPKQYAKLQKLDIDLLKLENDANEDENFRTTEGIFHKF
jgi:hypothetical protein